ncbi:hypothetical protein Tco_0724610 [Tanacetum coccineum]
MHLVARCVMRRVGGRVVADKRGGSAIVVTRTSTNEVASVFDQSGDYLWSIFRYLRSLKISTFFITFFLHLLYHPVAFTYEWFAWGEQSNHHVNLNLVFLILSS